ncbi:hypothetical protein Agabi119p4_5167 [Agaricus bisporus var. burnettii]|uniref:Uncharacterized protein n=1 Tax=Agaricus bisporus var. burnettii TaxID=192524 RepID=A0A8H7KHM6_AGABI|nr:hypothetical protein Agabi119p4_5167 [Agaricus bisporus var. burnettii]
MIHGPCGTLNLHASCMMNGKCSKGYPKPFQPQTIIEGHAYPLYCCPDDGRCYNVGGHMLDNRWVVPHSIHVLKRYGSHINVECIIHFGCLAYIMKYFKKPRDSGTLQLKNKNDEIERYIQGCYYSAIEAVWHIFGFEIHGQKPSVIRLPIHLPAEEPIVYDPSENQEQLDARQLLESSALIAFFDANASHGELGEEERKHTYPEFPQHFTLKIDRNTHRKYWDLRQRGFSLGRLAFIKPSAGERFYLQLLLLHAKAVTSFTALKEWPIGSGHIHTTFHEACAACGLLEDDGEWRTCLEEGSVMQTGYQLRNLFVSLLLFSDVNHPLSLWNDFKVALSSDLHHHLQHENNIDASDDHIFDYCLYLLNMSLQDAGHSLTDFPSLPSPSYNWDILLHNPSISDQLAFNSQTERDES